MKPPQVKYKKIAPMYHAEKCPVCGGFGEVGKPNDRKQCHGCNGLGYIEVPNFDIHIEGEDV